MLLEVLVSGLEELLLEDPDEEDPDEEDPDEEDPDEGDSDEEDSDEEDPDEGDSDEDGVGVSTGAGDAVGSTADCSSSLVTVPV